ncbi:hypothetical protein [Sphingomonas abietis]|uniref:Uncharacterized protein n=1 Tax=Sphingomonas abietis TaxID=3012344 RepID=A0ABY7NQH5_9SPHN|nr:hypothetical protein [Sphingomonas abietis]WBO22873.1 hypothetical protein PBT88_01625 [Sphingomonas abietis]
MKHDFELREAAQRIYCNRNLEPDSSFERAERKRDPDYLGAIDAALEMRRAFWDFDIKSRQLPLL